MAPGGGRDSEELLLEEDCRRDFLAACAKDETEAAIDIMTTFGADLVCGYADHVSGMSGLHYAAYHGNVTLCHAILDRKAPVDPKDIARMTPLHYACYGTSGGDEAQLDIVSLLCDYCANLTALDTMRQTPLHWAVYESHMKVCNNLLSWEGGDEALRVANVMEQMPVDLAKQLPEQQKTTMLELLFKEHPARVPKMAAPRRNTSPDRADNQKGKNSPKEGSRPRKAWTPRHPWRPTAR